jgi:serine/threonine-protein kinase
MEEALTKDPAIRIPTAGALADRIGQAFGLTGSHIEWARMSQAELGARIEAAPPKVSEPPAPKVDTSAMDLAMGRREPSYDAFKAGSAGGPSAANPFSEDEMVMGLPPARPWWVIPAIAGACVVVGAIVTFFIAR